MVKLALSRKRGDAKASSLNTSEECHFLLGDGMKVCTKCKQKKPINKFSKNKGYLRSWCSACHCSANIKWYRKKIKKEPWYKTLRWIRWRCIYEDTYCSRKGIQNKITMDELKQLWFRDKAWLLKRPTIDRINNDGHYEFSNCRFIELTENLKKGCPYICQIEGCDRKHYANGFCSMHHQREWKRKRLEEGE